MAIKATATGPPIAVAIAAARRGTLDAKTLPLAPDSAAQIPKLRLDRVVDRLARAPDILLHLLPDRIARDALPEVASFVRGPLGAGDAKRRRPFARPAGAASDTTQDRCHGPAPRRAAAKG